MADMLPKLFFVHFRPTSFVAQCQNNIVGFVSGFVSQTFPDEAYIHFVGVHPDFRGQALGKALYERFFAAVEALGCKTVHCVTSPVNKTSIAFHAGMGFSMRASDKSAGGVPVMENYDGLGEDRVVFYKDVGASRCDIAKA